MTDRFQGDPSITLDEDGSYVKIRGGQPEMDRGIENAVNISLFTRRGWPGNLFIKNTNQHVGSDFEEASNQAITLKALNDIQDAGYRSLRWMLDTGVASDIIVRARNSQGNRINVLIQIIPHSEDVQFFQASKNATTWQFQKIDPVHERME